MKLILFFALVLIGNAIDAMDQQHHKSCCLPIEVFALGIIPQIIETETESVKRARCDLENLSLTNKKLNKCIATLLENETFNFTEFFIDRLAHNNLLEGNKLAIAAHLGTKQSMRWIQKNLNLIDLNPPREKKVQLLNTIIQLDELDEKHYMKNAHKFLWYIAYFITSHGGLPSVFDKKNPQLFFSVDYSPFGNKIESKKLKNDTKLTQPIYRLFAAIPWYSGPDSYWYSGW